MCERQCKIKGLIWRWKCSNTAAMCASINMCSKCTWMWWLKVVGWYSDNEMNKVSRRMGGCVVGKIAFFELPKRKMLNIVTVEESAYSHVNVYWKMYLSRFIVFFFLNMGPRHISYLPINSTNSIAYRFLQWDERCLLLLQPTWVNVWLLTLL